MNLVLLTELHTEVNTNSLGNRKHDLTQHLKSEDKTSFPNSVLKLFLQEVLSCNLESNLFIY